MSLPKKIIKIDNPDKTFHEKWSDTRDWLDIPHPFRAVLFGSPNSGKSTVVKNIAVRCNPSFKKIIIVHCDPEFTEEYNDMKADIIGEIPAPEEFEGNEKTLVILEDLDYKNFNKQQKNNISRLFGYVSTHKNVSVCLCSQDSFNVPPIVRRCSNLFVFWKTPDLDSISNIARKTGYTACQFREFFKSLTKAHDSLWLDLTKGSPAPCRKNGYILI